MRTIIILSALLVITLSANAQTILSADTLTWTSVSSVDMRTQETENRGGKFITYPQGKIEMVQARYTIGFETLNTTGDFASLEQDGNLILDVVLGETEGRIIFERAGDVLSITLDFSGQEAGIYRKFMITNVNPN